MIITRVLPSGADGETVGLVVEHVRAELSAMAAADDNPETNADDVQIRVHDLHAGARDGTTGVVYEEDCVLVVGELDMEPDAPYLKPGYDPYEGVAEELLALVNRGVDSQGGKHERRQ